MKMIFLIAFILSSKVYAWNLKEVVAGAAADIVMQPVRFLENFNFMHESLNDLFSHLLIFLIEQCLMNQLTKLLVVLKTRRKIRHLTTTQNPFKFFFRLSDTSLSFL